MKQKSKYVIELNEIQKDVYGFLKKQGFKKSGRAFNRGAENGIYEVITFQMGAISTREELGSSGIKT